MGPGAKRKNRIQKRLGEIRRGKPSGCWVCGCGTNMKTARAAEGLLCKPCLDVGKTTPEVVEYEALKTELAGLNSGNA